MNLSEIDKRTLALAKVIQEMNFEKEQLEATLSTFILMRFNQDERQAMSFLCSLLERTSNNG